MDYTHVIDLDSEFEGALLAQALGDEDIPFEIRLSRDTALSSVFFAQTGWGAVYAPDEFHDAILEMVEDIQNMKGDSDAAEENPSDEPG